MTTSTKQKKEKRKEKINTLCELFALINMMVIIPALCGEGSGTIHFVVAFALLALSAITLKISGNL